MNKLIILSIYVIISTLLYISNNALAEVKSDIPRFVTIKYDHANARKCPKEDCPIEWEFIKKGEPVLIKLKHDQWYQIQDIKGEGGWVHSRLLSHKRAIIINSKNTIPLLASPGKYNNIVAMVAPHLRCYLKKCDAKWCNITCKDKAGWVPRKDVWGVLDKEWQEKK